jgi:formylglycine-generating enzyme required for sulfatase activity
VSLAWDLFRLATPAAVVAHGVIPDTVTSTHPIEFELPLPWGKEPPIRPNALDGRWGVRLTGADAAGNDAVPLETNYDIGLDGPDLELLRPAPSTVWPRNSSGRFEIEIRASDPNGVAELACNLRRRGSGDVLPLVLERTSSSNDVSDTLWKSEVALPPTWSRAELQIDLAAVDRARSRSRLLHSCSLPDIELALPARIAVDVGTQSTCPMSLVRGNHDREYVFGGRVDAEEDDLFRASGLGVYNRFSTAKSWQATCPPGEISDFYLDEREVSASEMLAFVQQAEGWGDPHVWIGGQMPTPSRRDELSSHLRAMGGELPATDVTWVEASAYARWAGKRLQSWLEWEYALRGGTHYRPWSGWTEGSSAPRPGNINCGGGDPGAGPWPSQRGVDITSDTGIAHLSDNVAEWTGTLVGSEKSVANRRMRAPVDPLPGAERDLFWVAGGSFERVRFDFSIADRRGRDWHSPDIGFRCAMSATTISLSQSDTNQRVRFHAIGPLESAARHKQGKGDG